MDLKLKRGQHVRSSAIPGVALWFVRHPNGDRSRSEVVMVGDDHRHEVETESLSHLKRSEFCGGCGQIGCAHGT